MFSKNFLLIFILFYLFTVSCGKRNPKGMESGMENKILDGGNVTAESKTIVTIDESKEIVKVVFLGDSLTEGYGLDPTNSYPAKLEFKLNQRLEDLKEKSYRVEVVNGGLSGDTTIGGLNRVDWFLAEKPDYLWVALGANDGLRGLDLTVTKSNLRKLIEKAKAKNIKVILAGMELPLNFSAKYRKSFRSIYPKLVEEFQAGDGEGSVLYFPFLLDGVGGEEKLNLEDGIHPNEKGYEIISDRIVDFFYPLIIKL